MAKMQQPTKEDLRHEISRLNRELIRLQNEKEQLESAKIPYWAYDFQGKNWVMCNPFKSEFNGKVVVIQNDYSVFIASVSPKDKVVIIREAELARRTCGTCGINKEVRIGGK